MAERAGDGELRPERCRTSRRDCLDYVMLCRDFQDAVRDPDMLVLRQCRTQSVTFQKRCRAGALFDLNPPSRPVHGMHAATVCCGTVRVSTLGSPCLGEWNCSPSAGPRAAASGRLRNRRVSDPNRYRFRDFNVFLLSFEVQRRHPAPAPADSPIPRRCASGCGP